MALQYGYACKSDLGMYYYSNMAFEKHITKADSEILRDFNTMWRAAGWGAWVDCMTDLPYGNDQKFFGSLFHPEDYSARLAAQHERALRNHGEINFSPLDRDIDRIPPEAATYLKYDTIFDSPNMVYSATALGVCAGAVQRAVKLYPGRVPLPDEVTQMAQRTVVE